jgi:hypothetical protein
MSDVLDRIRRELQERLESTRAAAQEHERVRAALEALEHAAAPLEKVARRAVGGVTQARRSSAGRGRSVGAQGVSATSESRSKPSRSPAATTGRGTGARKPAARRGTSASASAPRGRSGARSDGGGRASARPGRARRPRGANREAVLAVVRGRPGVTARELAVASGVSGSTLYSLLGRLTAHGELAKRDLPGAQTGYALASSDAPGVAGRAGAQATGADGPLAVTEDAATADHQPPADRP